MSSAGKAEAVMKLNVPKLGGYWRVLTLCGSLKPKPTLPRAALALARKGGTTKVATIGRGDDRQYLVVMVSGDKNALHFHVDLVASGFVRKPPPSELRASLDEVQGMFGSISGMTVDVRIAGVFALNTSDVPVFIRSSMVEAESTGIALRSTGGTIAVTGAPVQSIEWKRGKSNDRVFVTLEARTPLNVGPSYLSEAFELVETAFRAFVPGTT